MVNSQFSIVNYQLKKSLSPVVLREKLDKNNNLKG